LSFVENSLIFKGLQQINVDIWVSWRCGRESSRFIFTPERGNKKKF